MQAPTHGRPRDHAGFARAMTDLLLDPDCAKRLGDTAQQRVRERFLPDRYLARCTELLVTLPTK